jgi:hypothetical protein
VLVQDLEKLNSPTKDWSPKLIFSRKDKNGKMCLHFENTGFLSYTLSLRSNITTLVPKSVCSTYKNMIPIHMPHKLLTRPSIASIFVYKYHIQIDLSVDVSEYLVLSLSHVR